MGRNYFTLCNDILREMYYEEAETFVDLDDTTEGRKVKAKLNQILTEICINEKDIWVFRERTKLLYMISDENRYPLPNGYIEYIVPIKYPAPLLYNINWKYLPRTAKGRPIHYRIYDDKIEVWPTPNNDNDGFEFEVKYLTYDCAIDEDGIDKEVLVNETDEPIIPNRYRDILVYGVCKDLRAGINDPKSMFYDKRYKDLYRAMLSTLTRSDDYPTGNDIMGKVPSIQESSLSVFYNPRAGN